jgi:cold shock CspA family protein
MVNFTNEESQLLIGKEEEGRITTYNLQKGYGFARTSSGKEIFISSYQVGRNEEKKLCMGTRIVFKYGMFNNKICATDVRIVELFPSGKMLEFETSIGSFKIGVEEILKLGISNLIKNKNFLLDIVKKENIPENFEELGYSEKDFKCLFIETKKGDVYRFFDLNSKLQGNGCVNVSKIYTEIYKKFFT